MFYLCQIIFYKIHLVYIFLDQQLSLLYCHWHRRRIIIKKHGGMAMKAKVWMVMPVAMVVCVALAMPAAAAKLKINIGSTYGPDAPAHFGQVKFKELVEQRSKGEMEVLVHVGGAMGGERDVFEAMRSGGLEILCFF